MKRETQKVKMLGEQYERLQQTWSEHAMLFHDMDNHLQAIYYLAGEGRCQEIQEYITRISRPFEQLSGILWTGVGIVDAASMIRSGSRRRGGAPWILTRSSL